MTIACSKQRVKYSSTNYLKEAAYVNPVVIPSDIRVKPAMSLYNVPPVATNGDANPPSLIPPGSKVRYYQDLKKQGRAKS